MATTADQTSTPTIIFASRPYAYLGQEIASRRGFRAGHMEIGDFPDGERHLRLRENLVGKSAIVIGGTIDDAATLELYDIASGLVAGGINYLQLVIPYFGYSTQERAVKTGDVVLAKTRAVLLSSVPCARLNNEVILFDLHTPGIAHYFEGAVHCTHLSARSLILDVIRKVAKEKGEPVIACTDAGRAKWVETLANEAGFTAAFVYKKRLQGGATAVTGVNADVKGRHVILYDDMIRSGGSLVQAAEAYRKAGASGLTGIVTHGVFHDGTLEKLQTSGLFDGFHCTDSHPRALMAKAGGQGFLQVHPIAGIVSSYLI